MNITAEITLFEQRLTHAVGRRVRVWVDIEDSVPDKIGTIVDLVCQMNGITREQLLKGGRFERIKEARHLAMYLCKRYIAGIKIVELAQWFGCHHTTVLAALQRVETLLSVNDEKLVTEYKRIDNVLNNIMKWQ